MNFQSQDSDLFLAIAWAGGGPLSLADLIHVYDWINRAVLTCKEMNGSLTRLLAAGLIKRDKKDFLISAEVYGEFEAFRKRRKKDRFEVAEAFLRSKQPFSAPKRRVRISELSYRKALDNHGRAIRKAFEQREVDEDA